MPMSPETGRDGAEDADDAAGAAALEAADLHLTQLLERMSSGDELARDRVWELLHGELRRCAERAERKGGPDAGLQATELIGVAFMRVSALEGKQWADRAHFVSVAALAMRSEIVDFVRRADRWQDDSTFARVVSDIETRVDGDLVGFYDELETFAEVDPAMAHALELKALGYGMGEIAELLRIPPRTFNRHFERARAHLRRRMRWTHDSGGE